MSSFEAATLQTRNDLIAAAIHQARQPLSVVQNCLSALARLSNQLNVSTKDDLTRKCIAEMRNAVNSINNSLSRVEGWIEPCDLEASPVVWADFLRESFQIGRFVLRRRDIDSRWQISSSISGSTFLETTKVQFKIINWALEICENFEHHEVNQSPISFAAEPQGNDILVVARGGNELGQLLIVSTPPPAPVGP